MQSVKQIQLHINFCTKYKIAKLQYELYRSEQGSFFQRAISIRLDIQ